MKERVSPVQIFLTIIGILVIFFLPHFGFGPVPFFYVLPVLLIVRLLLNAKRGSFSDLGFSFKRFEWRAVLIGAAAAVLLFVFLQYIFFPLLNKVVVLDKANLDDFKNIRHNFSMYLFVIIMGWLVGGIYEELVFHGFIFKGIEKIITGRTGFIISFFLTNLIFGLYHFQLGASGIINAFAAGCAYHALAIKFQRNLWFAVFFHGFFDTIALSYIYLGYW